MKLPAKIAAAVLLFLAFVVSGASAQESVPVITLQQAIDAALAKGDNYKILQGNLAVTRAVYAESVSKNSLALAGSLGAGYGYALYPGDQTVAAERFSSLSSSAIAAAQGGVVGLGLSGPLTSVNLSLSPTPPVGNLPSNVLIAAPYLQNMTTGLGLNVSQTLLNGYPGGTAQATVDKSLLTLQGQELSTDSGRLALIYQVKQAYYAMFAALQELDSTRQVLQRQSALLDQITAIYNLKQASAVDLKTAQINAHSAQIDVAGAEHTLRLARIRLAIIMAMSTDTQFTVTQPPGEAVPATTLDEAISVALSRRAELKLIELNRRANAVDMAVAQGLSTPTISVGGGVDILLDNALFNWVGFASAGVKVSMPILDSGAAQNLIDQSTQLDRVYAVQLSQQQKSIAADVQDAWESMELAREKVALAQETAENDDLLVDVYKIQRASGTASTQDLLTASVNAANAHSAAVQAQSVAQLAVLQLLSVMGY